MRERERGKERKQKLNIKFNDREKDKDIYEERIQMIEKQRNNERYKVGIKKK